MSRTQTLDFYPYSQRPSIPATLIADQNELIGLEASWPMEHRRGARNTLAALGLWGALALGTTVTNPVVLVEPNLSPFSSGSSSVMWAIRRRRGRAISLRDAYQIAIRISNDTERRLRAERAAETNFALGTLEDDFYR